jgi:hypothetical protein
MREACYDLLMVESAYRTDERAGSFPLLRAIRTDYHFSRSITSVWRLGPLEVKRNHHPRQVSSYTLPSDTPSLFDVSLGSVPFSAQGDHEMTAVTIEQQEEATRRWHEGKSAGTPNWDEAHSDWSVSLRLGRSILARRLELSLS